MKNTFIFLISLLFSVCFAQQQKPFAAGVDVFGGFSWGNHRRYQMLNYQIMGGDEMLYGANLFATYKAHSLSDGLCSAYMYEKRGYQVQYRYCLKQFFQQRLSVSLGVGYQKRVSCAYRAGDPTGILTEQVQAHAHVAYRLVKGLELTAQGTLGRGGFEDKWQMREKYTGSNYQLVQFNAGLKYALVQR
jgi:hypothetical protein